MFTCKQCLKPTGPKVSPVVMNVSTRNVPYENVYTVEDDYGNEKKVRVFSTGWEVVKEAGICPTCALGYGVKVGSRPKAKPYEKPDENAAEPFKTALVYLAAHNALKRIDHAERGNQRAQSDCREAIPLIKGFVDRNKEYVF